jgi:hypothetical protein
MTLAKVPFMELLSVLERRAGCESGAGEASDEPDRDLCDEIR